MLKHVHNTTLCRRPSKQDSSIEIETELSGSISSVPSSPTPSSCNSSTGTTTSCSSFNFSTASASSSSNGKSPPETTMTGAGRVACQTYDCATLPNRHPHYNKNRNRSASVDESKGGNGNTNTTTTTSSLTWKRTLDKLKTRRKGSLECGRNIGGGGGGSMLGIITKMKSESTLSVVSNASTMDLQENSVPLRVYANCLRPDIQYKTIGINSTTTCDQVVDMIFNKCKLPYKDPKLFYLALDLKIRNADGSDMNASIPLEGNAHPLKFQECYPNGQAKFSLQMNLDGKLVRIFDKTGALGWDYKGVMISDKTTAGELLDILFRFTTSFNDGNTSNTVFTLHVEVDEEWSQKLEPSDMIIPMQNIATQFGQSTKLIVKSRQADDEESCSSESRSSSSMSARQYCFMKQRQKEQEAKATAGATAFRSSTVSLRDNRNRHRHHLHQVRDRSCTHSLSLLSTTSTTDEDDSRSQSSSASNNESSTMSEYWRRRRSHSLSSSSGDSSSVQSHDDFIRRRRRGRYHHLDLIDTDAQDSSQLMNRFRMLGITTENGTLKAKASVTTTDDSNVYNRIFFNSDKYQLSETFLV